MEEDGLLRLHVWVGQVSDTSAAEPAWEAAGDLLRSLFGPVVGGPGLSKDGATTSARSPTRRAWTPTSSD